MFGNIVFGAIAALVCVLIAGFWVAHRQQKWAIVFRFGVLLLALALPQQFANQVMPIIPEGQQPGPADGLIMVPFFAIWLPLFLVCVIWTVWSPVAALAAAIRANRPST
jgi:hypothetical protein